MLQMHGTRFPYLHSARQHPVPLTLCASPQYVLESGGVLAFVRTLPIRKVAGVGRVTERMLREVFGITLCGDILRRRAELVATLRQAGRCFQMRCQD